MAEEDDIALFLRRYEWYREDITENVNTMWQHWNSTPPGQKSAGIVHDTLRVLDTCSQAQPNHRILSSLRQLLEPAPQSEYVELLHACTCGSYWPILESLHNGHNEVEREKYCKQLLVRAILAKYPSAALQVSRDNNRQFILHAAMHGDANIIREILDWRAKELNNDVNLDAGQRLAGKKEALGVKGANHETALTIAIEEGHLDVVKEILQFTRDNEFDSLNAIYVERLMHSALLKNSMEPGAGHDEADSMFEYLREYRVEIELASLFSLIVSQGGSQNLLKSALSCPGQAPEELFTIKTLAKLITSTHSRSREHWTLCVDFWRRREDPRFCPHAFEAPANDLLHSAVKGGRDDIVADLLRDFPTLAQRQSLAGIYPLKLVHSHGISAERRDSMRNAIVDALIQESTALEVEIIASECQVKVWEFNLELGKFDSTNMNFKTVVQCMIKKPGDRFQFERVLKSVTFPQLIESRTDSSDFDAPDHDEVKTVMEWLHNHKGVRSICKLVVPDRQHSPHDWKIIHWCIKTFAIKELDWRVMDMFLCDTARDCDEAATNEAGSPCECLASLETIHLYSSGNKNTIEQWSGEYGLKRLKKLKDVKLRVITDKLSKNKAGDVRASLNKSLRQLKTFHPNNENFRGEVTQSLWASESGVSTLNIINGGDLPISELTWFLDMYKEEVAALDTESGPETDEQSHISATSLPQHETTRSSSPSRNDVETIVTRPTKVAIVDDGMMMMIMDPEHDRQDLHARACRRVQEGRSFVYRNGGNFPWWLPSKAGHGTQMACLISRLDPHCQLYIAQVSAPGVQMQVASVTKAIRWAIEKKVDIISLSLALRCTDVVLRNELKSAIDDAEAAHIVIICSTSDEGRNVEPEAALPAGFRSKVISVSATDDYGEPLQSSQRYGYDYCLRGHNITLGNFDFLQPPPTVSGSSISTATAAGLASLVIALSRAAYWLKNNQSWPEDSDVAASWRKDAVVAKFNGMQSDGVSKYVRPDKLLEAGQGVERSDMRKLVKKCFQLIPAAQR